MPSGHIFVTLKRMPSFLKTFPVRRGAFSSSSSFGVCLVKKDTEIYGLFWCLPSSRRAVACSVAASPKSGRK